MRLREAPAGKTVVASFTGFPVFFLRREDRILTNNVWALLSTLSEQKLSDEKCKEAKAYLRQAQEFFTTASSPNVRSKPVLYYYSFLNLVKVLLLHRGVDVPPNAMHGIREAHRNFLRDRFRFEGQEVRFVRGRGAFNVAPELCTALGVRRLPGVARVSDLMGVLPSDHRTWVKVKRGRTVFCPVRSQVLRDGAECWVRLKFSRNDTDVKRTLPGIRKLPAFRRVFSQVNPPKIQHGEVWFDSVRRRGRTRGVDTAILSLADLLRPLRFSYVVTSSGYRYYIPVGAPCSLPQLAASFAAMYYFGSIARYRPFDYTKLIDRHAWLIGEFLETEPAQFVYGIASTIAGIDVVQPFAIGRADLE